MSCEQFQNGDNLWIICRKILGCLNDAVSYLATIATGGGGSVGTSFGTAADIILVTPGTRVRGGSVASPRGVLVVASMTNTGSTFVGGANVTNATGGFRGIELLQAGMSSVVLPVANLNQIYIDGETAGNRVGVTIL